jgi:hypothetical protein
LINIVVGRRLPTEERPSEKVEAWFGMLWDDII